MTALKDFQKVFKILVGADRGFHAFMNKVKVVSAGTNHCVCEMEIDDRHVNILGTLHGGCTATLVDVISSMPISAVPPHRQTVSVDLSISYLRSVGVGEVILIEAKDLKVGKNLMFADVTIKRKSDGELVATGKHTKFILDGNMSHL